MHLHQITAYLAACGVKRFTIELDDTFLKRLNNDPELNERLLEFDIPPFEQPKAEQPKAEQPKAEQPKAEQPKAEQPKAEQPKAEQPKAEQPKAEQPKATEKAKPADKKKADAAPAAPAATSAATPAQTPYEMFLRVVERDDGGDIREKLAPIVQKLSLDDLLRIKAEFTLPIDTDQETEKIREETLECW